MEYIPCPQCNELYDEDEHEYCPHCLYGYWDDEVGAYDVCPQCGGTMIVKVNPGGTQIENICEDCSYYSVDVE